MYTKVAEHVELRGESIISNCDTADSIDYRTLFCEMFSDSEESTISESSGDSDDQVDSGEEIELVGHVKLYQEEPLASDNGDNDNKKDAN